MKIPFKKIEISDIERMLPYYTMRRNNTCDSVFLESFIWKDFYNVRFAVWEDRALLWLMEYNGKCFSAMPLCREADLPDAFYAIQQYFNEELGYPLVMNLADEDAVNYLNLPAEQYFVEEQVDSRDYLYKGEALRVLSGKRLRKKKNHINAFKRNYEGRYEYRVLCCSDSHFIWQFLDKWREGKGEDAEEHLDYEVKGIHDILKNCSSLNIRMGGVFIDGQMEAFTIGSYNPVEDMAVIHIEKANPEINGLYQFINREFLLEEFPEVEWVNREDDLGIEGLRVAKMSYEPADFAKKYLVEQIVNGKHGYRWAEDIANTRAGEESAWLSGEDKENTRALWKNCFAEDSDSFLDYYYTEKTKDNKVLIKKQNGLIVSMLHLNPYRMRVREREWDIDYIVGVATEESRRHSGHMRELLEKALNDMAAEKKPFVFLMPASEAIYLPFGFTFIFDQPEWKLKDSAREKLALRSCTAAYADLEAAADFMESWLRERYEVYCRRDAEYAGRLLKELCSENGRLDFLMDGERLAGLWGRWGLKKPADRLLYASEEYVDTVSRKPAIMARIEDAETFLSIFSLDSGTGGEAGKEEFILDIGDPVIKRNNRYLSWTVTSEGAFTRHISAAGIALEAELGNIFHVKIEELTAWLFGCRAPGELWPEASKAFLARLDKINVLSGIFIDEVV